MSAPSSEPPTASPARRAWGPGLLLVALGGLWLARELDVALPWRSLLAVALVLVGIACLVGGRRAAHLGLVGVGSILSVVALVASLGPWPSGLGVGNREHTVRNIAELDGRFGLLAGELVLDLTDLELPAGDTELGADVLLGQMRLRVPPDVEIRGDARTLAGQIEGPETATSGLLPRLNMTAPAPSDDGDAPVLVLDLRVGLGQIEVER